MEIRKSVHVYQIQNKLQCIYLDKYFYMRDINNYSYNYFKTYFHAKISLKT